VLDQRAYESCGAESVLEPCFEHLSVVRFTEFELNPKIEDVECGVRLCKDFKPDIVIALGGGTAIDLAKMIGTFSVQDDAPRKIALGQAFIKKSGPPLIAIPTTAGTGSEATHFAVVYVDGEKYSCAHSTLLPDYAVVDPELTSSLPKEITAATGLDAFCQAIESIWAVGATDQSIIWATEAAKLAWGNLVTVTQSPTAESRAAMSHAAHLAGKAINVTKTTAPHALSYHLTSHYGTPHGIAVAMMLSPILAFNSEVTDDDCVDPRGATHVQNRIQTTCKILDSANVAQACEKIERLISQLDCPASLTEIGVVGYEATWQMIESVNLERMLNNPRRTSSASLLKLFTNE